MKTPFQLTERYRFVGSVRGGQQAFGGSSLLSPESRTRELALGLFALPVSVDHLPIRWGRYNHDLGKARGTELRTVGTTNVLNLGALLANKVDIQSDRPVDHLGRK